MLDDLLGRCFSSKVKSLMKVTKMRIEAVRKKRNATQKFLKKDIADLLANGHDINAFGRAEGLVTELIISSCYDFVEHCCDCVLKHLSALQKNKRECPEECNVAVASLMFAAARFSDLPELRDLRQIFQGRYGNSLEHYINQKFVKNLSAKPASTENKLQLMQDVASQYSVVWNAKAFEQRMSNSHVYAPKEHLDYGSFCGSEKGIHTASNYKTESGNSKNKVDYTSLHGLFDRPNQDSKENAKSRKEAWNTESFDEDLLSGNVNKASSITEDVSLRRVEPVLPLFSGKSVTDALDPNNCQKPFFAGQDAINMHEPHNGKLSFRTRRGMEVSDALESHNYGKLTGKGFTHLLESQNGCEQFPKGKNKLESQNQQEVVTSDAIQSSSFSPKIKLGFVNEGFVNEGRESLKVSEKATVQGYKHFHPPPYVTPSKAMRDAVNFESKDVSIQDGCVAPQVDAVDNLRPKPGSSRDGSWGQFDSSKYVKPIGGLGRPPKPSRQGAFSESKHAGLHEKGIGTRWDAVDHVRTKSGQMSLHALSQFDHHEYQNKANERGRAMNQDDGEDRSDHSDLASIILPKPRSIRRRRSRRSSSNDSRHKEGSGKSDEKRTLTRTSNTRRRRESRSFKQHTLAETDIPRTYVEDKILDNLLIHYSSKPSNVVSPAEATKKSIEMPATTTTPFPPRSISLPREQSVPSQPTKVFTRAATFQLDRPALHVHPKLPDYDDLAAKFAAMKGKF